MAYNYQMDDFEKKESLKESNFYRRELVLRRAVILSEAQIATLNPICIRLKTIKFNRYHIKIGIDDCIHIIDISCIEYTKFSS